MECSNKLSYYERNKELILQRYKQRKPYKAYYERNKERLRQLALYRYYEKKLEAELIQDEIKDLNIFCSINVERQNE